MAEEDDAFGFLRLGKGHGGLNAGQYTLGVLLRRDLGHRTCFRGGDGLGRSGGCFLWCRRRRVAGGRCRIGCGAGGFARCGCGRHLGGLVVGVGQGQAEAAPADIGQFVAQRADGLGPVGAFAVTRNQDHHTAGLGGIGRLPQGEKTASVGRKLLLLGKGQLLLQGLGLVLAALGHGGVLGGHCRCRGRGVCRGLRCGRNFCGCGCRGVLFRPAGAGQQQAQAAEGKCRSECARHQSSPGRGLLFEPNSWAVICQAALASAGGLPDKSGLFRSDGLFNLQIGSGMLCSA